MLEDQIKKINKEFTEKAMKIIIENDDVANKIAEKCGITNQELYELLTEETITDCKISASLYKVLKCISEIENNQEDN